MCVFQDQGSEGPHPLPLSQDVKGPGSENPSANEELDTPTSIASVMTSTNESSMETDTPHQTDNEVPPFYSFLFHYIIYNGNFLQFDSDCEGTFRSFLTMQSQII